MQQLGSVLTSKGDYAAALTHASAALAAFERLHGADHPDTATALHRAGAVHAKLGEDALALERFEASLAMKRRIFGDDADHLEIATTIYRIGTLLERRGDAQQALERYLESLYMQQRLHEDGEPRPDEGYALFSIGAVLYAQGAATKALEHFEAALEVRQRIYGEDVRWQGRPPRGGGDSIWRRHRLATARSPTASWRSGGSGWTGASSGRRPPPFARRWPFAPACMAPPPPVTRRCGSAPGCSTMPRWPLRCLNTSGYLEDLPALVLT